MTRTWSFSSGRPWAPLVSEWLAGRFRVYRALSQDLKAKQPAQPYERADSHSFRQMLKPQAQECGNVKHPGIYAAEAPISFRHT